MTETADVPLYTDNTDKPLFTETPEEREFELRAAVGSYWTGGRLVIGMFTFLFASLAFAYFYLRSNNSGKLWRPDRITAPTGIGWAIFAVVLASVLLAIYGQWRLRSGLGARLGGGGWVAVVGGAAGHRPADLAADRAPVLPRLQRLRVVLHRLGGDEHHPAAVAAPTGWRRTWPVCYACKRLVPEEGSLASGDGVRRPSSSGPTSIVHLLLGLHRRHQRPVLGVLLSDLIRARTRSDTSEVTMAGSPEYDGSERQ